MSPGGAHRPDARKAQLILIAAVALAAALVPVVLAYVQLGFHNDVGASQGSDPSAQAERTLEHGLHNATADVTSTYPWAEQDEAVRNVRNRLASTITAVNRSRLDAGQLLQVTYNRTRATRWAESSCPGGPDRQFGPCESRNGIVVQERADRTHVLGMAVDIHVTTPESEVQLTIFVHRG